MKVKDGFILAEAIFSLSIAILSVIISFYGFSQTSQLVKQKTAQVDAHFAAKMFLNVEGIDHVKLHGHQYQCYRGQKRIVVKDESSQQKYVFD